jgi:hypothetical protein
MYHCFTAFVYPLNLKIETELFNFFFEIQNIELWANNERCWHSIDVMFLFIIILL